MTDNRAKYTINKISEHESLPGRRRGNDLSGVRTDHGQPLAGRRIMVAEDNVILSMHVAQVLESAGAEVVGPYPFAKDALAKLDDGEAVDCAVLDYELVGSTSVEVADRLGDMGVPYAFFTSHERGEIEAAHVGVPVVSKPNEAAELVTTVTAILS